MPATANGQAATRSLQRDARPARARRDRHRCARSDASSTIDRDEKIGAARDLAHRLAVLDLRKHLGRESVMVHQRAGCIERQCRRRNCIDHCTPASCAPPSSRRSHVREPYFPRSRRGWRPSRAATSPWPACSTRLPMSAAIAVQRADEHQDRQNADGRHDRHPPRRPPPLGRRPRRRCPSFDLGLALRSSAHSSCARA